MIVSPRKRLRGVLEMPGDKSITHRALVLGALAKGETRIERPATGEDCASTRRCLEALGVRFEDGPSGVTVLGGAPLRRPPGILDCGNSGTTMRLLTGLLAASDFECRLDGDASLRRRPMERVARPLRRLGAHVETTEGRPPIVVRGRSLSGTFLEAETPSAQVKGAALLAGLRATGETTYAESVATRDHTERLLGAFGVPPRVNRRPAGGLEITVPGGAALRAASVAVPGDPSSAAFFIVAALLTPGSEIEIRNALLNPLRIGFVAVLHRMGADVHVTVENESPEPVGRIVARASTLSGTRVCADEIPGLIDEIPVLAVAAARARGTFAVTGAGELRVKETDRIAAIGAGLSAMGVAFRERPDGFELDGAGELAGAHVASGGDHRLAMAFAVAGLVARGATRIAGPEAAAVSFPGFFDLLFSLGEPA